MSCQKNRKYEKNIKLCKRKQRIVVSNIIYTFFVIHIQSSNEGRHI